MKAYEAVKKILGKKKSRPQEMGQAYAPVNIALCKYWGKRDDELNLPVTSSLSIALPNKGTTTTIQFNHGERDHISVNGEAIPETSFFSERLVHFLDLFRGTKKTHFDIWAESSVPIGAGLASSASGFASLVLALNQLYRWQLDASSLSILARLGSGSACRSIAPGFVKWLAGNKSNGMDSYAEVLPYSWKNLRVGICLISPHEKAISSRQAMQQTLDTSPFYPAWPQLVKHHLKSLEKAIADQDFELLGTTAESNSLAMHACALTAYPPICYSLPETVSFKHKIWALRAEGLSVYFTQDAGPNLKLLFLVEDEDKIINAFPDIEIITPFQGNDELVT